MRRWLSIPNDMKETETDQCLKDLAQELKELRTAQEPRESSSDSGYAVATKHHGTGLATARCRAPSDGGALRLE